MQVQRHCKPSAARAAIASYNFVPLPEAVVPASALAEESADWPPSHNCFHAGLHTGYFTVEVETKSLLYIRCALAGEEFIRAEREQGGNGGNFRDKAKNTPHFFYHDPDTKKPVIPGSSLRGMLRQIITAISYGKMTAVDDQQLIYRAVADSGSLGAWYRQQFLGLNQAVGGGLEFDYPLHTMRGGYLIKSGTGYKIRPAQMQLGESFVLVRRSDAEAALGRLANNSAHPVEVAAATRTPYVKHGLTLHRAETSSITAPTGGRVPETLIVTKAINDNRHWYPAIYAPVTGGTQDVEIPPKLWNVFHEDERMNRSSQTQNRRLVAVHPAGNPTAQQWARAALFYLVDDNNDLVFFGSTMMFRLPYHHTVHGKIPDYLLNKETVDVAEALFGYVPADRPKRQGNNAPRQGDKRLSYASRLSFGDATLAEEYSQEQLWATGSSDGATDLAVLATPKPTCYQHYLEQPNPSVNQVSFYDSPKPDAGGNNCGTDTAIRGLKFYPHQRERSLQHIQPQAGSPQAEADQRRALNNSTIHTQVNPVKAGIKFSFTLRFENLSDAELGALCWALAPQGDPEKKYVHSLGMGKPLGMGAIKLTPHLHLSQRVPDGVEESSRYEKLFETETAFSWHRAERYATDEMGSFLTAFERAVLRALGGDGSTRLADQHRIQMLLKLLEWRGLQPKYASSMHVKRFKERRILPHPDFDYSSLHFEVAGNDLRQAP